MAVIDERQNFLIHGVLSTALIAVYFFVYPALQGANASEYSDPKTFLLPSVVYVNAVFAFTLVTTEKQSKLREWFYMMGILGTATLLVFGLFSASLIVGLCYLAGWVFLIAVLADSRDKALIEKTAQKTVWRPIPKGVEMSHKEKEISHSINWWDVAIQWGLVALLLFAAWITFTGLDIPLFIRGIVLIATVILIPIILWMLPRQTK